MIDNTKITEQDWYKYLKMEYSGHTFMPPRSLTMGAMSVYITIENDNIYFTIPLLKSRSGTKRYYCPLINFKIQEES